MSKTVSPRIGDATAEFYPGLFRSLNAGVEFALDAFPQLYRRTLHNLRGRFSQGELSLMIDVFNNTYLVAQWLMPDLLGRYLEIQCSDGIALDGLDQKWEIEKTPFLERVRALTLFEAACLELWAVGYWATLPGGMDDGIEMEKWLKPLLEEKPETT